MLEMRPKCERCEKALPCESNHAWICSYECTFCGACASGELSFVCPNCKGELVPRPRRKAT
jgi:hypothetical protein